MGSAFFKKVSIDKEILKSHYLSMAVNSNQFGSIEETLDLYFGKKAPQLPEGVRNFIVMIAPWLILISVILSIPALLALIGISSFVVPMSAMMGYGGYLGGGAMWTVSMVLLAITVVLEALAIPGLFKKAKSAWNLVFYSVLVSLLSSLVVLNLVGFIISALISFYILFQIRSSYR